MPKYLIFKMVSGFASTFNNKYINILIKNCIWLKKIFLNC